MANKTFTPTTTIKHNGKRHMAGVPAEFDDKEVAHLVESGDLSAGKEKADDKKDDKKD